MRITVRKSILVITGLLFAAFFFFMDSDVMASVDDCYFSIGGNQINNNEEYELTQTEIMVILESDELDSDTNVEWITEEDNVASIEETSHENIARLVKKGPGYTKITANIETEEATYSVSFIVKVDLMFDILRTGFTTVSSNEKILLCNNVGEEKQIFLQNVIYDIDEDNVDVVSNPALIWNSHDRSVATVDEDGKVTATGAGNTIISITTTTFSGNHDPLQISLKIVVSPKFSLTYDDKDNNHHEEYSVADDRTNEVADGVPANFVVESNALLAGNLKWEVYDFSTGAKLSPSCSKLTYTISEVSGNISFNNVKAGTYKIYAYSDEGYISHPNVPYAYMMLVVPIDIKNTNIVMAVGDIYDIMDNSNIPSGDIFKYVYIIGNSNTARLDQATSIISALGYGEARIRLRYQPSHNLFDDSVIVDDIFLDIKVIDEIVLNITEAKIFTRGFLMLNALVTDPTKPITWSSDNPGVATVDEGLVNGISPGMAVITARQNVKGVVKKATCFITVQDSVSSISLNPNDVNIAINGYTTMHALITPENLNSVTLHWESSNDNIVSIVESSPLSVTVRGVAGGHAVVLAINEENVVVGYCHVYVIQPVTDIVLSETNATIDTDTKELQLRVSVYPENAHNKDVSWKSTNEMVAKVDENGLVSILSPGTVSIIATSEGSPKVSKICNLYIKVPVATVALDETEVTMIVGQAKRLTYHIMPQDAMNAGLIWTSTNNSVVSVDATGYVTAKGVGTAVIIVQPIEGGKSDYCTIKVREVTTGIKFDVDNLEMNTGETYHIKMSLTPAEGSDSEIIWESSDTNIAKVDEKGIISAKESGTVIIMAYTEGGGVAYCNVTVKQSVHDVIINFSEKTIFIGSVFQLKASVSPSDASELGVTWESLNPDVASVTKDGVVAGLTGGVTIITCSTVEGGYKATCKVIVREFIAEITLDTDSYRLGIGKTKVLVADIQPRTSTDQKLKWVSDNENIATVNQKGKVTGIAKGFTYIKAIAQDGSESEAVCDIEVVSPVTRVTIDKTSISMYVGNTRTIKASISPSNSTYKGVFWSSSDESVAIINEDGRITALKSGSTTIKALAKDNSGKKATCRVTVRTLIPATGISVIDKKLTMAVGEKKVVRVALNPSTSTDQYYWSVDNTGIVTVDNNGRITAKSTGNVTVTVMTDSGKTASVDVSVIGLNMTKLTVEQYTTYETSLRVEGTNSRVNFSIDNPAIAVLMRDGNTSTKVSSRAVGKTTITAIVDGRKFTCKLTVTKM